MIEHFAFLHIPHLLIATTLAFGGLTPYFNAEYAILEFELPMRVAISKSPQSLRIFSSSRASSLGLAFLTFYSQEN